MNKPLYEKIYISIKEKILSGEYPPNYQLPSEKVMAEMFEVSTITTKRALTQLVEEGYIFRQKGRGTFVNESISSAQSIKHGRKNFLVGVILSEISMHYGLELLKSIESSLSKKADFLFKLSHDKKELEDQAVVDLISADVDGLIVLPRAGQLVSKELVQLVVNQYPLVMIDRNIQVLQQPSVATDNTAAVYEALQYLIDLSHTEIAVFSSELNDNVAQERINAVTQFGFETGIHFSKELFLTGIPLESTTIVDRYITIVKNHLLEHPQITAILALNYTIAQIIKIAAEQIGRSVGEDLSVICFDSPESTYGESEFTHMKQNELEIGNQSVNLLLKILNGESVNETIKIDAQLVEGKSTCRNS